MQTPPARATTPIQPLNRDDYVKHILDMKKQDQDYARYALKQYDTQLPDLELMTGVRDALKGQS